MSTHKTLAWSDNIVTIDGAVSLELHGERIQPWRIFHQQRDLYEPDLLPRAADTAGVRLTLLSDTATFTLNVQRDPAFEARPEDNMLSFDLRVDGTHYQRQMIPQPHENQTVTFCDLPAGEHLLELYLPQRSSPLRLGSMSIDANAYAKRYEDTRPKWVVYGSSITQCGGAAGPSETWPAIVANQFGLNLTCLGFGGQCKIDPMMGRTIGKLPADYISLCLGINVLGGDLSPRTFRAAVIGLIQHVRDKHPHCPIVCVSPIYSPNRESTPGTTGMTLELMREWILDATNALQAHGDKHLAYADGLELFGPDFLQYLPDDLHPNAQGYRELAKQYAKLVMPKLGLTPKVVS